MGVMGMILRVAVAGAVILGAMPVSAQEVSYHLPHAAVAAGWQARVMSCPGLDGKEAQIDYRHQIAGAYRPGEMVRLNSGSPFLGSRSIALTYHENGLLKTVNAEGEGKGGAVIATLLKTAAGFITLGPVGAAVGLTQSMTPPGPGLNTPPYDCRAEVRAQVSKWRAVKARVDGLETQLASGVPLTALQSALYESDKLALTELEKSLTLSTSSLLDLAGPEQVKAPDWTTAPATATQPEPVLFRIAPAKPLDLSKWFVANQMDGALPVPDTGRFGFCALYRVKPVALVQSMPLTGAGYTTWLTRATTTERDARRLNAAKLHDRLIYLRPVAMTVTLFEATALRNGTADCPTGLDGVSALRKLSEKTVTVPQLSGYHILPLGAGLFESKSAGIEFAPDGRIISLSRKGSGAGAGVGEALAGALTAAETVRDDRTKDLQRRIERIKAEDELDKLLTPGETSEVTPAS
jgi:hypothetical protein